MVIVALVFCFLNVVSYESFFQIYITLQLLKEHNTICFTCQDIQARQASFKYSVDQHTFPLRSIVSDKPKAIDASQIFKQPHRATRPDHIVIILRGLPGTIFD